MRALAVVGLVAGCSCRGGDDSDTGGYVYVDPCADPVFASRPSWEGTERTHATGLAWADVDGSGEPDLIIASGNDQAREPITVHLAGDGDVGDVGDGTISDVRDVAEAPSWTSARDAFHGHVAVGDLDEDGFDDVIATRFVGDAQFLTPGGVDLYRGGPDGLIEPPAWSVDGYYTFGADLGDVDGDGDLDLALAVGEPYHHDPMTQVVFLWDAAAEGPGFSVVPDWSSADAAIAIAAKWADVDGDGDLDLVQARSGSPHVVYRNDPPAGLEPTPSWEAPGTAWDGIQIATGDIDSDGALDVVFTDNTFSGGPGVISGYCGPSLEPCLTRGDGEAWSAVSLHDVDGDGRDDLVAGQWFGPLVAWHLGDGVSTAPFWRSSVDLVAEAFAWREIERDGLADLFVSDWDPAHGPVRFDVLYCDAD